MAVGGGIMWRRTRGNDKKGSHNFEGGLNTGRSSFHVKDDQYIGGFGWDTEKHPALTTRKGRQPYGTSGGALTRLLTNYGNTHLLRAVGTKLQYHNGTDWTGITGTFTNTDWDSTNFDVSGAVLLITNGTDNVKKWNGSALSDLSASAPKGKYIASDNRRVYIAVGDVINYCAFQDATDWTTAENSGSVQFYTANGGDVTALYSFDGQIWAFKKDSFCLIFHTGDARVTHRLVEVSNDIGCVSHKTVQEVGARLFWLGQNEVYMGGGGNAIPVGDEIRNWLDDINTDHIDKCFAGTDGLRYYLGLVTGSNTEPNILLSFDPRRDRRRWDIQSEISDLRYSATLNNVLYNGGSSGQTYKLNAGTDDNGTAIPWEVVTKDFDEGIPEAEKEYYELHLQIDAPTGTTLTVQASVDQGETYTTVGDPITTDTAAQNVNMIIPLDTVPLGNWMRFKLSGTGQFTLYQIQRYFRVQPTQH
jgi:hypothetical protein